MIFEQEGAEETHQLNFDYSGNLYNDTELGLELNRPWSETQNTKRENL